MDLDESKSRPLMSVRGSHGAPLQIGSPMLLGSVNAGNQKKGLNEQPKKKSILIRNRDNNRHKPKSIDHEEVV